MSLPHRYCACCREMRIHAGQMCIQCRSVQAVTHPAAYRDEMGASSGTSDAAMQAKRKRGQVNARLTMRMQ
jgi:hypothetical protein